MANHTEVLIIGAGSAGISASNFLAKNGKKVTLAGKQLGGGYCSEGVLVSSLFRYIASMYNDYRYLASNNFIDKELADYLKLDIKKVKKYIDLNINKARKVIFEELEDNGVNIIEGFVEFLSPNSVLIRDSNGQEDSLTFDKCIVSVGSYSQYLSGLLRNNAKPVGILNYSFFDSIPLSINIIGGGFVGVEAASLLAKLGSKVTIIEKNERILLDIDPYISKKFEDILKKKNIDILTGKTITNIEKIGQKCIILLSDGKLESEEVFISVGRVPLIMGLNLAAAGVKIDNGVPIFNKMLRTNNENIYLAGDVTNLKMNNSWAYHSALVSARNILGEKINYNSEVYPTIVYSDPQIASIGLCEDEAKNLGYNFGSIKHTLNDYYVLSSFNIKQLFIKIIYDKDSKQFLGIHIVGDGASELISFFTLLINMKARLDKIPDFILSQPIYNELLMEITSKIK